MGKLDHNNPSPQQHAFAISATRCVIVDLWKGFAMMMYLISDIAARRYIDVRPRKNTMNPSKTQTSCRKMKPWWKQLAAGMNATIAMNMSHIHKDTMNTFVGDLRLLVFRKTRKPQLLKTKLNAEARVIMTPSVSKAATDTVGDMVSVTSI